MAEREKISILVTSFNEERNIRECLESCRWADELVLIDSFSTDRTREIGAEIADRVIEHEYVNAATQRNWGIPQMAHPWVMIVDSDERVTPKLRDEVLELLAGDPDCDGYYIYRQNYFMGKRVRFCGWQSDKVLRLFRREQGQFEDAKVHATMVIKSGKVGKLRGKFLHYPFESFAQYMEKFDRYSLWAAGDRARVTRQVRFHHLLLRPGWRFFRQYILKLGFLDGLMGLVICKMAAHSVFMKYARVWEWRQRGINHGEEPPEFLEEPGDKPADNEKLTTDN